MCLTSNNFVETSYFVALASFFAAVLSHLYQSCFSRIMCNFLQILHETNRKRYARRLIDRPGIATRYRLHADSPHYVIEGKSHKLLPTRTRAQLLHNIDNKLPVFITVTINDGRTFKYNLFATHFIKTPHYKHCQ